MLFNYRDIVYNLCPQQLWLVKENNISCNYIKVFSISLTFTSSFFTASENKFYSITNPIAKERPTGLSVLKGSSLKGALRHASIESIEEEMINNYFSEYEEKEANEIVEREKENDRFYFKKRLQIVKLFGNEKGTEWFTFKSLITTGGISDVSKIQDILEKINNAFLKYLKKHRVISKEEFCKGRLIFEDIHFTQVGLDVITPLDRRKRTPVRGPIFYEVVPEGATATGRIIWLPFDLVVKDYSEEKITEEWQKDKEVLKCAFERLSTTGIGAKTAEGWGRFRWEEIS